MKEGVMWILDFMDIMMVIMVIIVKTMFGTLMSKVEMINSMVIMYLMSRPMIKATVRDLMTKGMI